MIQTLGAAVVILVLGFAFWLMGYRVFLVMLPIWGFFAGFWMGAEGISLLFGTGFLATVTGWVVGFVAGLMVAALSYAFYSLGVALVSAGIGAALATGLLATIGFESGIFVFAVGLGGAIVVAGLTLFLNLQKYVVIVLTTIAGANALVVSALLVLGQVSLVDLQRTGNAVQLVVQDSWFWSGIWLVLAVAGVLIQVRSNRTYTFSKYVYMRGWA